LSANPYILGSIEFPYGKIGHVKGRTLIATLAAVTCLLAGCSSAPSKSYLDGQKVGTDLAIGGAPRDFGQMTCSVYAAEQLPAGDNKSQWEAGCVQGIDGG